MTIRQRWYRRHQLLSYSISPELASWLFDTSSLTARLLNLCGNEFSVQVIAQKWQKIAAEERFAMSVPSVHSALVRRVLLCCGDTPLVYARTVIPATTIQGKNRRYANLGNRPLGAMLFADRTMKREAVEIALLPEDHFVKQDLHIGKPVWGRRSVFRVSGKPLMVAEYFLPSLFRA